MSEQNLAESTPAKTSAPSSTAAAEAGPFPRWFPWAWVASWVAVILLVLIDPQFREVADQMMAGLSSFFRQFVPPTLLERIATDYSHLLQQLAGRVG